MRIPRPNRDHVDRRPTAIAWKSFLLVSCTPQAFGITPLPPSLEDGPAIWGRTAVILMWVGCFVSVVGLLWWGYYLDGLVIEQMGLIAIALGCALYGSALLMVPRLSDAALALGLCLGIAVASGVQFWTIRLYRKRRTPERT